MNENGKPATLDAFMAHYYNCQNEAQKQMALRSALAVLTQPYQEEPLLNLKEVSEQLQIAPSTAWRWQLPWREWRGAKRYLVSECKAYLASDSYKKRRQELNAMRQGQGTASNEQSSGNAEGKRRGRPATQSRLKEDL